MNSAEKPNIDTDNVKNDIVGENSWQNPGKFPEFAGNEQKTNIDRLQLLLDKIGFSELKRDDEKFKDFIATTSKQDIHRYLSHINQKLREISPKKRGFHEGRMLVGNLISPNRETQTRVLDYEIDALVQMHNPRYRAASAYYMINDLHMFRDGNGRTSRAIFELLDNPRSNISEQQQFFSHEINDDQSGYAEHGSSEFERSKNIVKTKDFNQLAMLGYLEKLSANREKNKNGIFSSLKNSLENKIEKNEGNILMVYGGTTAFSPLDGYTGISAFENNSGFNSLSEDEQERVCYTLHDNNSRVSVSGLAMLKFYQEKGQQGEFLKRTMNESGIWLININPDPEEKEYWGHCECEDWDKEDFLHYAELAESIKEQVLKTGVDIFISPDKYKFSGESIADVATNAKKFYKEKE